MGSRSLVVVLKAAVLAGLIAGVVASGFHWIWTEPFIDRAVEIESQRHGPTVGSPEEPVVSRSVQKAGLFAGFLLYGGAWGIFFGLLVYAATPWFPKLDYGKHGFFLALLLGWTVAIFPLLKYPANPPGVGEAETISYRQELFLGFIALSLIGTVAALGIERWLRRVGRPRALVPIFYTLYLILIYVALPSNPDPVKMPVELVSTFHALSLSGQLLFWGVMGGSFLWLCRPGTHRS